MDQAIHDIAVLLNEMNEGRLRDETSRQLTDLVGYLHQHALDTSKSAKGKLNLTLCLAVDPKGLVTIEGEIATKQPKPLLGGDCFFVTKKNGLSRNNPRQPALPFRAVPAPEARSGLLGVTVKRIRNETLCLVVEGSPS